MRFLFNDGKGTDYPISRTNLPVSVVALGIFLVLNFQFPKPNTSYTTLFIFVNHLITTS